MTVVTKILSDGEFNLVMSSLSPSVLAIIYFNAPWAKVCQEMSTVFETLASTYSDAAPVRFLSINAEELNDTAEMYEITAVPRVVVQRDGHKLEEISGSDASKLRAAVERHVSDETKSSANIIPPLQTVRRPPEGQEATPIPSNNEHDKATPDLGTQPHGAAQEDEDISVRLQDLVKAAPVMLFMKGIPSSPQCGFSRKIVDLLREKNIRYGFFNILADEDVRTGLKAFSEWPTFPQLYVAGQFVGGLDIVSDAFEDNENYLMEYSAKSNGSVKV